MAKGVTVTTGISPTTVFLAAYDPAVQGAMGNYWAWAVTALFLAFVVTGLVLRGRRKRAQG